MLAVTRAAGSTMSVFQEIIVVWGAAILPLILGSLIAVFKRLGNNHTRTREDIADLRHEVARIAVHVGLDERDRPKCNVVKIRRRNGHPL